MTEVRIMIVEDERITAFNLEQQLRKLHYAVVANVGRAEDALVHAQNLRPQCVLMDIHLAGSMDGIGAAAHLLKEWDIPVVFLTAYADHDTLERAGATMPYGYLVKPFEPRQVEAALRMALARHASERALRESQSRLALALDAARMTDFELDPESGRVTYGRYLPELPNPDHALDMSMDDLFERVHPDERPEVQAAFDACLQGMRLLDLEFRNAQDHAQTPSWTRVVGRAQRDGGRRRLLGVVEDVTNRHLMQSRLEQSAQILSHAGEGIFIADVDWRLQSVNPAYLRLMQETESQALGQLPRLLAAQSAERLQHLRMELLQHGHWHGELQCETASGSVVEFWASLAHKRFGAGENLIGMLADITELKQSQARLRELAYFDGLTGLPNRVLARDRLEQAVLRAERSKQTLGLLFIDLDHFKTINDGLGHAIGDLALVEASRRMASVMRASDTLARLSGDEFIALIEGGDVLQGSVRVAEAALHALAQPLKLDGEDIALHASIGMAYFPLDADDSESLLRAADKAMYKAKTAGGQRYRAFDASMLQPLIPLWKLETELRQAVLERQFELHYQPQVDNIGRLVGVEALIRWNHPRRGLLTPGDFLDALDSMGMMSEVTDWVLEAACRQMAAWRAQGREIPRVGVNVHPTVLQQTELPARVAELLQLHGLPGASLEVEIIESALQTGLDTFVCLEQLAKLGVTLALDDFGVGFSSLSSIKHLPLHRIKIDREFVRDLHISGRSRAIAATVLALAQNLGMEAIAEGVEEQAQVESLLEMGCHHFQGYFYARPMSAAQLVQWQSSTTLAS